MMLKRIHISSFIALTIIVWLIALWVQGNPVLEIDFIKPFSIVVGAIMIIVTVFNKYAWAWKIFKGWYVKIPDLRGAWLVEIKSSWIDPETNTQISPIVGYCVIRQTLTSLSFRLMTSESRSKSIAYSIELQSDGLYLLSAIYRNEPKIELQGVRSEIHHGSFILHIHGDPVSKLDGHYWTDRASKGSMILSHRKNKYFNTFEEASEAYSEEASA